jgi:hypothetical protein
MGMKSHYNNGGHGKRRANDVAMVAFIAIQGDGLVDC